MLIGGGRDFRLSNREPALEPFAGSDFRWVNAVTFIDRNQALAQFALGFLSRAANCSGCDLSPSRRWINAERIPKLIGAWRALADVTGSTHGSVDLRCEP